LAVHFALDASHGKSTRKSVLTKYFLLFSSLTVRYNAHFPQVVRSVAQTGSARERTARCLGSLSTRRVKHGLAVSGTIERVRSAKAQRCGLTAGARRPPTAECGSEFPAVTGIVAVRLYEIHPSAPTRRLPFFCFCFPIQEFRSVRSSLKPPSHRWRIREAFSDRSSKFLDR